MVRNIGKEVGRARVKVDVSAETYSALRKAGGKEGRDEAEVLRLAIERGIDRFWLHWFDEMAKDFEHLKKRYEECQRDNRLLTRLVMQNEELRLTVTSADKRPQ